MTDRAIEEKMDRVRRLIDQRGRIEAEIFRLESDIALFYKEEIKKEMTKRCDIGTVKDAWSSSIKQITIEVETDDADLVRDIRRMQCECADFNVGIKFITRKGV